MFGKVVLLSKRWQELQDVSFKSSTEPPLFPLCCHAGRWSSVFTCVTGWQSTSSSPHPTLPGESSSQIGPADIRGRSGSVCPSLPRNELPTSGQLVSLRVRASRLMLRELGPWSCHMRWLIWVMACIGSTYVFFFHERYQLTPFVHARASTQLPLKPNTSSQVFGANRRHAFFTHQKPYLFIPPPPTFKPPGTNWWTWWDMWPWERFLLSSSCPW